MVPKTCHGAQCRDNCACWLGWSMGGLRRLVCEEVTKSFCAALSRTATKTVSSPAMVPNDFGKGQAIDGGADSTGFTRRV